jgi:hypothetical protein
MRIRRQDLQRIKEIDEGLTRGREIGMSAETLTLGVVALQQLG